MPDGREWTVESDSSVTDPSAEVVSPVCRWEDIETVQALVRHLRQAGARTDDSCGIHVHVGLGEHTPASLRRLVNLVNAKEDLLTAALGITPARRNRWCAQPAFLEALNKRKQFIDTLKYSDTVTDFHPDKTNLNKHTEKLKKNRPRGEFQKNTEATGLGGFFYALSSGREQFRETIGESACFQGFSRRG